MNAIRWIAQSKADLALVLGARLNWTFRHGRQLAADASLIQVDVHAAEFERDRTPTVGVASTVDAFLRALLPQLGIVRGRGPGERHDSEWLALLRRSREATKTRREARARDDRVPLSPLRLARELRDALSRDAITIFDGNLVMEAMEQTIPAYEPASRLTPGCSGCLGVGIPFAIAAKLLHPARPVVAICGDFAFGMSAMELETAVRHDVPIVVVVANNDGNSGALRQNAHMGAGAEPVTRFHAGVHYDRIMEMFGGYAEHVSRPDEIRAAIGRAIASGRPACINVAVDPDAPFPVD
jgi:thiamine pyrophosphate-dependent acetolactate synthase large subunit-like protein